MSGEPEKPPQDSSAPPREKFPPVQFPTVFADGIAGASIGPGIMKIYLGRVDPSFTWDGTNNEAIFAQIIMPTSGFVRAALFFESQVQLLVQRGIIDQNSVDELRAAAKQTE